MPPQPLTVDITCEKYVKAVIHAKAIATDIDTFWADKKIDKAYRQLRDAIDRYVAKGFHWQHSIFSLAGSMAEELYYRNEAINDTVEINDFTITVHAYLHALQGHDWIASLPLERLFGSFPKFTDFGSFYLINPSGGKAVTPANAERVITRFRNVLTKELGILFVPTDDVNSESYLNLAGHFFRKTDSYIPSRAQMVMRVGKGDEVVNKAILSQRVCVQLSLLALCQIAYELDAGFFHTNLISPSEARLPNQDWIQDGLIEVPGFAVAIIAATGKSALWTTPQIAYDTKFGVNYEPKKIVKLWKEIAVPFVGISDLG